MLDRAFEYLELGLSVLPLLPNAKIPPKGITWKEQQNILPSKETVESRFTAYPGCNIGCITGRGSQIIVIDADSSEAMKWVEATFPSTPLMAGTGSEGRRHYYYKYPDIEAGYRIVSNSGAVKKDVDIRGDGGLIVLPPSIHKSGRQYQWIISEGFDLDFSILPELPIDLVIVEGVQGKQRAENGKDEGQASGLVENIGRQCSWLNHCRLDASTLPEPEWFAMLSIVGRCIDGPTKCHNLSRPYPKYDALETDRKIKHALESGPATCRSISRWHEDCFACPNLGRGKNFSPIILGEEERIDIEVLREEDLGDDNEIELFLSDYIVNPGGLISNGMNALGGILQYTYPVIITHIARAIAGKVTLCGVWPSIFCLKIGGTSTGKTDIDNTMSNYIRLRIEDFYGPTDFSSGPGLFRGVMENPAGLICMDEITYLFRRFDVHDPITSGKISALLELSTKAGQEIHKPYSDKKNTIKISYPCVNLIGNATPTIFDDFRPIDFETGLIQRFDFYSYDGEIPYESDMDNNNAELVEFTQKLQAIMNIKPIYNTELLGVLGVPTEMELSSEAEKTRASFSKKIIDQGNVYNKEGKPGFTGICSRTYTSALKYCMIHHVSSCMGSGEDIFRTISTDSLLYGIAIAELLGNWKINILPSKIYEGDFHRDCEVFKDAIRGVIKMKKKPTGKLLVNRKPKLKELKPHEWQAVVRVLTARKEIIVDETEKSTIYRLTK